ncbi:MAG TPA: hypothetical protein VNR61_15625 [Niallia sp.]|nr:hypothetical protein [Niallia sp.]
MQTTKKWPIELINYRQSSIFDGYEITFSINNQNFQFFIGNRKNPFPFSIKHQFKEKEICTICNKMIAPVPVGQQLCMEMQKDLSSLLKYFQKYNPEIFI